MSIPGMPAPKYNESRDAAFGDGGGAAPAAAAASMREPPPYGQRRGFVPRSAGDFGDGGAFPEIHVAQYPLDMGRKDIRGSKQLGLQTDADGNVRHDIMVHQGRPEGAIVASLHSDLLPKDMTDAELARPDEEAEAATQKRTAAALAAITDGKVKAGHAKHIPNQDKKTEFLRYTPQGAGAASNSGAGQRLIQMVEMPVDPLEPPKFKHKKVPRGAPEPPVPVMHSPPRKLTVEDQASWKIPPCISNWKNSRGYTIPLDKRLAADGRDTQKTTINDNFAKLSESLYVAERVARDEVKQRAEQMRKLQMHAAQEKDAKLRELAQQVITEKREVDAGNFSDEEPDTGDAEGREQRDQLRQERKREREREYNIARAAPEKRTKLLRERERDVSEKVALGQASAAGNAEVAYDARLFNQSEGMSSGFGADDSYNTYDKPLFERSGAAATYRPGNSGQDMDAADALIENLKAQKHGGHSKGESAPKRGNARNRPVEFEKEQDPFGLDQFLDDAKKGSALDKIGSGRGVMGAGGASMLGKGDEGTAGSGRSKIDFKRSS